MGDGISKDQSLMAKGGPRYKHVVRSHPLNCGRLLKFQKKNCGPILKIDIKIFHLPSEIKSSNKACTPQMKIPRPPLAFARREVTGRVVCQLSTLNFHD